MQEEHYSQSPVFSHPNLPWPAKIANQLIFVFLKNLSKQVSMHISPLAEGTHLTDVHEVNVQFQLINLKGFNCTYKQTGHKKCHITTHLRNVNYQNITCPLPSMAD